MAVNVTDVILDAVREEIREVVKEERETKRRLMPEKEVLAWLGLKDARTLRDWVHNGMKCYQLSQRLRFYDPDDVEEFIKSGCDVC